jgi:hypothetical protein
MSKKVILLKTHRYTFSEEFESLLNEFAQIHRYDERKTFKREWEKWSTESYIHEKIEEEKMRLLQDGFKGYVEDKMFKCARYYFRKKPQDSEQEESNEKKRPRKKTIGFTSETLMAIDKHIIEQIKQHLRIIPSEDSNKKICKSDVSPEKAYEDFYNTHKDAIFHQIQELKRKNIPIVPEELSLKFKKTYKNRFHNIRNKINQKSIATFT